MSMETGGEHTRERLPLDLHEARLFRVSEASKFLGVSRTTLYELMANGSLKSIRIGGARRVPALAITEFVADRLAEADCHSAS